LTNQKCVGAKIGPYLGKIEYAW